MELNILSRTTIGESVIDAARKASGPALDKLWESRWIKDSIEKKDIDIAGQLYIHAMEIREKSDVLLISAPSNVADSIEAVLSLLIPVSSNRYQSLQGGSLEVVFCPNSLDPARHKELIEYLENKNITLLAISIGEEDLIQRANYALYKKVVFTNKSGNARNGKRVKLREFESEDKTGRLELGNEDRTVLQDFNGTEITEMSISERDFSDRERVYAIVANENTSIARDASENNYPAIRMEMNGVSESAETYLANSPAVLLPLLALGTDVEPYLNGFYDVVASPEWDRDAGLFGYLLRGNENPKCTSQPSQKSSENQISSPKNSPDFSAGSIRNADGSAFDISCYQREFAPLCRWFRMAVKSLGQDALLGSRNLLSDIIVPFFEGCDTDGSLGLLNYREANNDFFAKEEPGFKIEIENLDPFSVGSLMAFVQISMAISKY